VHLHSCAITASKCISKLAQLWAWGLLDHDIQLCLQTRSIMASMCISEFTQSLGLQVHQHTRSITILECSCQLTRSQPPSVSPNTLDSHLQVHLQTCSFTMLECISKFTRSWPPSVSPNSLESSVEVNFQARLNIASECNSEFTWLSFSWAPQIAPKHHLHSVPIYCV